MGIGLGVLGLAPVVFWSMTPREFQAAVRGRAGPSWHRSAPDRAGLEALMARYPDGGGAQPRGATAMTGNSRGVT